MIRPRYALKLARTKLRSKRFTLLTSVIISSVLFASLIACVIVFSSAERSASEFVKKAGNDKYLVRATPIVPDEVTLYMSPNMKQINDARAFEKEYNAKQKEAYKKAGVTYDESTEEPILRPNAYSDESIPEAQRYSFNFLSSTLNAYRSKLLGDYVETAPNNAKKLRELGARYGATGYYEERGTNIPQIPQSRIIRNDKEDFSATDLKSSDPSMFGYLVNAAYNSTYMLRDQSLLDRYLLIKDSSQLEGIPVVISAQEAASLFGKEVGIGKEPSGITQKYRWFLSIQEKLKGHTYQTCVRSSTETMMLEKVQRDYADIKNNGNNKDYKEPSLQYDYPTTACGDITVKKDTRTTAEKKLEQEQIDTQKKLGTYVEPAHQMLTFQIVGFMFPQPYSEFGSSAESFLQNLLTPQYQDSAAQIPTQLYDSLPADKKLDARIKVQMHGGSVADVEAERQVSPRVLEFPTIELARKFLSEEACSENSDNCKKLYVASAYGSNYLILDEIGKLFKKIVTVALPVVLGLALVIMWFTISRIMAENRKETAVYRAMGAKRRDVLGIYATYVLLITFRIALLSFALGIGAAYVLDMTYGSILTESALASFGISSANSLRFSLFGLSSPLLVAILACIFLVSLLASIQPLIRNTLRAPIEDMREE